MEAKIICPPDEKNKICPLKVKTGYGDMLNSYGISTQLKPVMPGKGFSLL